MNDSTQALAFFAGANSIFQGDILLTAPNPETKTDVQLLDKLGLKSEEIPISNNALFLNGYASKNSFKVMSTWLYF